MWTLCRMNAILHLLILKIGLSLAITPTTCTTPRSDVGEPAFVTCYFHKDIFASREEISVKHYPVGSSSTYRGNDVLLCYWLADSDKPSCIAEDGYQFNGNITTDLTLAIPSATKDKEGTYACHIIPPDDTLVHECELIVQERPGHQLSTAVPLGNSTTGNVHCFSQTDDCDIQTALAIFFGLVLVLSIACNVVLFLRRQNRFYCRLFSERHRVNKDEDFESAEQHLLEKKTARVHPETSDASSQLYNLVDLADESVVALYSRDQQLGVTPHFSTDGNAFDNFTFCAPGKSSNNKKKNNNTHSATEQRNTGNILDKETCVKVKQD